jgi:protocatechuate 3,4-dioxygenase beta subunit
LDSSTRRGFFGFVSGSAASLLQAKQAQAATESPVGGMENACILTPQSESGPYYVDPKLVRSDITDGKAGVPLTLRLRVIEAGACTAMTDARVDIWHCDARGVYSAFPGQGDRHNIDMSSKTFLRGTQTTDAAGWAGFRTIYPGWYPGRATHIHFKVFLDERSVLVGQTFFPDALNEFIYNNVPDYKDRPRERAILNVNDRVALEADPEHRAFCAVKEERDRYVATLTLAVARNADPSASAHNASPPPGPPPAGPREGAPAPGRPIKDRLAALVPGLKRTP